MDDLYREFILEHYRNPQNYGTMAEPTFEAEGQNPLCGDELHLELLIEDGRVVDLRQSGQGCSISQAAASMMTEVAKGLPLDDALAVVEHFRLVMHGEEEADEDRLGDAIALEGVAKYPVRIKCALLGWMALKDAIETYRTSEN